MQTNRGRLHVATSKGTNYWNIYRVESHEIRNSLPDESMAISTRFLQASYSTVIVPLTVLSDILEARGRTKY